MNKADTAFVLASAGLVLLMTPGLALFYGGMVRKKNVLGTIKYDFDFAGIDRMGVSGLFNVIRAGYRGICRRFVLVCFKGGD